MVRSAPAEPPATPLTDGVVSLRLRRESDVDPIATASHDPEIRRWLDDTPMDAQARRTALARAAEAWRSGRAAPLVIADAVTDEPLGMVNLQFRDDEVATVAYGVFPQQRGRGIAPRAVRLLAGWARTGPAVRQVLLETDEDNTASIRVAEKSGFRRIGAYTRSDADGVARTVLVFAADPA
ncbi:GNAT family N-acetyltransferase [Micromonospora auratinigra]|uniref:Protein N-acetyltransferase, RimJ/RimL family n=1 Tax=Micromonospora auratinigra TaxID=261654 RepID=A0A1A8Z5X8_9ACTN|nr:GNAT family protein [Micromonospora auratinigra]SBT39189.1 Protein N-acetyltransferase, RimJ/RimL family [Micromonospora auratinigra]